MTRYMLFVGYQLFAASICAAQSGTSKQHQNGTAARQDAHVVTLPSSLKWTPLAPPPGGWPGGASGAEIAVISGDPNKAGAPFVIRIKNPDGLRVPPHWHPTDEPITVLTGTFVVGMGSTFDAKGGQAMPVGSYMVVPAKMPHFATAQGEVIIQVHGIGPFGITWVNQEDASAKKPSAR
jgi:hypothetical protein